MYHYTNLEGFKGILSGKTLWLTSARYMNDPTDCRRLFNLLKDYIENFEDSAEHAFLCELLRHCELNYPAPYITSFSSDGDDISQWDRYGDNGQGVCMEFDESVFGEIKPPIHNVLRQHNLTVFPVNYDEEFQKDFVSKLIKFALEAHRTKDSLKQEQAKALVSALMCQFSMVAKYPGYSSEKEIRVIHTPFKYAGQIGSYQEGGCVGALKVRESSYSESTPYVLLEFPEEAVLSIKVGPKSTDLADVTNFTRSMGFKVPIDKSYAPFR